MHLWRTGGIRNRGTKKLVENAPYKISWDEKNQVARCRVRGKGSNPDGNTAYDYSIAFELDELLSFLDELAKKLANARKERRLIRKHKGVFGKFINYVLEHKD